MEQRHFHAHELVDAIRSKATHSAMMQKYGLTTHQLDQVLATLVKKGMINPEELPKKGGESTMTSGQSASPHSPTPAPVFTCPHCGSSQPYHFDECPSCGIIVARFHKAGSEPAEHPNDQNEGVTSHFFHEVSDAVTYVRTEVAHRQQEREEQARREEQAKQYAIQRQLDQWTTQGIPEVPVPITLKRGETGHYSSPCEVLQQKTETTTFRIYAGTRSSLFKIPLYLGASMPIKSSKEQIASVGTGTFTITSKRIVLTGNKINYSITLDKINGIQLWTDAVQLFDEGPKGGRFYKINDPQHASLMLGVLLSGEA